MPFRELNTDHEALHSNPQPNCFPKKSSSSSLETARVHNTQNRYIERRKNLTYVNAHITLQNKNRQRQHTGAHPRTSFSARKSVYNICNESNTNIPRSKKKRKTTAAVFHRARVTHCRKVESRMETWHPKGQDTPRYSQILSPQRPTQKRWACLDSVVDIIEELLQTAEISRPYGCLGAGCGDGDDGNIE